MKFMGSKSRITKYIVPIIQEEINKNKIECYIEPFVGGSNVIDKIICKEKIGCDLDPYLIALLKRVQVGAPIYNNVDKKLWDEAKKEYDINRFEKFEPWQIGCIKYLASYNGRGSFEAGFAKDGIEHLKNGKERERHYYQEAKANLLKQASKEQFFNIEFKTYDYRQLELEKCLGTVVYCDPPYLNTKQYENSKNFDHEEFWEIMRQWSKNNIVLISELQAPDDFECIWEMGVSRSIKAQDKSRSVEKIFRYKETNYELIQKTNKTSET